MEDSDIRVFRVGGNGSGFHGVAPENSMGRKGGKG
jgi:hypothetical protein